MTLSSFLVRHRSGSISLSLVVALHGLRLIEEFVWGKRWIVKRAGARERVKGGKNSFEVSLCTSIV